MKKISLLLSMFFITVFGFTAAAQTKVDDVAKFSKQSYDVGKLQHNKPYTFDIEFTNISKKPLVVENAYSGCGCTFPQMPKTPIAPGKKGKITVTYDAKATGSFNKEVTLKFVGIAEPKEVYFSGTVEK